MTHDFVTAMRRSLELTRGGDLTEATRAIQAALSQAAPGRGVDAPPAPEAFPRTSDIEDAEVLGTTPPRRRSGTPPPPRQSGPTTPRRPLGDVIAGLARARRGFGAPSRPAAACPAMPEGATFGRHRFDGPQGGRDYRLYVPANREAGIRGVIMMLHGCTQNPEDFAAGTGMNAQADRRGFVVVWPEQTRADNAQACWNWFRPSDQAAGTGEPAILAALARDVAQRFDVPDGRVFAAGLSAGGAMASILGATHPDLFGAVGVHSGLAAGAAQDVVSAFAAMRGEAGRNGRGVDVPAIVFHGSADGTVSPANADRIAGPLTEAQTRSDRVAGRLCRVTTGRSVAGRDVEIWRIEGAGHAWSGGSADGSYADPTGPGASALMLDFFEAHLPV